MADRVRPGKPRTVSYGKGVLDSYAAEREQQRTAALMDELRAAAADPQARLVQQLFQQQIPEHYLAQNPIVGDTLPTSSLRAWIANLGQWNKTLPKTVGGLRGFEAATPSSKGGDTIAHYRPTNWMEAGSESGTTPIGDSYKFGINPTSGIADLRYKQLHGETTGWNPTPEYPTMERADAIFNHEMGHALEQRLETFATKKVIEGDPSLSIKLRRLRNGLVNDALEGNVSGYAQNAVVNKLQDSGLLDLKEVPQKDILTTEDVAKHALGELRGGKYEFGDPTLRALAQEPIAEAFSRDPGVLNEVLSHAKAGGFQGMITPELAMRGAAGMAIPLIAHAAFPHNELVDQAANGAGLGMAFGGLPGAAIGAGANVLAHHFLGIGL